MKKLGLIVNPIAGMGGAVGLKGTDGPDLYDRAVQLGAVPRAGSRAEAALEQLARLGGDIEVVTYAGDMGERTAIASGLKVTVVGSTSSENSTPDDTKEAARVLAEHGVDLLLFAGGDGTARDIFDSLGDSIVALGIPAGVKIQSAVFATSPAVAGQIAESFLSGGLSRTRLAEVMDIDEEGYRREILSARLYGYLEIPDASGRIQSRKAATAPNERVMQDSIAAGVIEQMDDARLYVVGPGTTCRAVLETMNLAGTLLGIDIVQGQRLVAKDANERQILDVVGGEECTLILTPVGGQGFVIGRGNQQISPQVIRKIGPRNIQIIATSEKLFALRGRPLLVDSGDSDMDDALSGYHRVITGYRDATIYKVSSAA